MEIFGNLVRAVGQSQDKPVVSGRELVQGEVIAGRVGMVNGRGEGVLRLADGSSFSFSGGQALKEGEQVRLEVVGMKPQITLRLLASESGAAQRLAGDVEQSLMRSPDIFSRLMDMSGLGAGTAGTASPFQAEGPLFEGLFSFLAAVRQSAPGFVQHPLFVTGKGESMAAVLQRVLPNLSLQSLQQGDLTGLLRLMSGGRGQIQEMLRELRLAANDLRPNTDFQPLPGQQPITDQDLSAARQLLHRIGDLLAMQDILPQTHLSSNPAGDPYLGYRLFWLDERGLGELIWRKQQQGGGGRSGGDGEENQATSVLVTLNLSRLGTVQAHLSYASNTLQIALGAEEDISLNALREDIRDLRQALLGAELPLRSLELSRMTRAKVQEERLAILELGSGFSVEV
ncbi:MAG: flagellar hook-length control protein FliK [Magnetococcales bacterium]|nr:flagellar hook-length control protein FliK [Magnetococcales bacterium]MBF0418995.1 flagellar hook-length control protein FliK [Magnetococcales bacterium]MBF0435296.1 flagellar hook-length control protein FliK [Magnetococcales bacterium]